MDSDLMRSRLYDKILMSDEESCWPWLGARNSRGYGNLRIGDAIKAEWPQVERVRVEVSKLAPPLGGKIERVTVGVTR